VGVIVLQQFPTCPEVPVSPWHYLPIQPTSVLVDMNRATKYRRIAADCFAVAQQLPNTLSKVTMLASANAWLRLADYAEQSSDSCGLSPSAGRAGDFSSRRPARFDNTLPCQIVIIVAALIASDWRS
jgi:hypothetical protein